MRVLVRPLGLLLVLVVAATGLAAARSSPYPVHHEVLGRLWREEDLGDDYVMMGRTTIQPGAAMPPTRFSGEWIARVETGVLTIGWYDGGLEIDHSGDPDVWPVSDGGYRLTEWNRLSFGPDTTMTWSNAGTEPVVIITTAIIDGDVEPMMEVDLTDDLGPEPDPLEDEVVKRLVLRGPSKGLEGYRYRITVRDRSGRLVGARVPAERELRFARGWLAFLGDVDGLIRVGPAAFVDGDVNEVLVTWLTGVCGPRATLDIGADLFAIRVIDRTPSCDAAGMEATVALRFRGSWTNVEDVEGILEYQ